MRDSVPRGGAQGRWHRARTLGKRAMFVKHASVDRAEPLSMVCTRQEQLA